MKLLEEKTQKLQLPEPTQSTLAKITKKSIRAKVFRGFAVLRLWIKIRRVAWIFALASVFAAYLVGTRIYREPHQPPLLPETIPLVFSSITPVTNKSEPRQSRSLPSAVKKTLSTKSVELPQILLRCRIEMGAPRFATDSESPFPQCEYLLAIELRSGVCSRIRQEFAETIYLLAYAFSQESSQKAKIWTEIALRATSGCASNLIELRKRTLELQRKINGSRKAIVGIRM